MKIDNLQLEVILIIIGIFGLQDVTEEFRLLSMYSLGHGSNICTFLPTVKHEVQGGIHASITIERGSGKNAMKVNYFQFILVTQALVVSCALISSQSLSKRRYGDMIIAPPRNHGRLCIVYLL